MVCDRAFLSKIDILGTVCSSLLLGISAVAESASAQTAVSCPGIFYREPFTSRVEAPAGCPLTEYSRSQTRTEPTPEVEVSVPEPSRVLSAVGCPGIFYREPFTSRVEAPADCPLTEFSRSQASFEPAPDVSVVPVGAGGRSPVEPSLPDERSYPVARVMPAEGMISVTLTNDTGDPVTYEIIGDTQQRMLMAGETVMLQDLAPPTTITAVRQGDALLDMVVSSSESGMLKVTLTQATDLNNTQGVLRIQQDGEVFKN